MFFSVSATYFQLNDKIVITAAEQPLRYWLFIYNAKRFFSVSSIDGFENKLRKKNYEVIIQYTYDVRRVVSKYVYKIFIIFYIPIGCY